MENKGNMSVHASMKSSLHLLNRKPKGISSIRVEPRAFSSPCPNGKTVNTRTRRRPDWEGTENLKENNNKPWDRWCIGSTPTPSENSTEIKPKSKSSSKTLNKVNKTDSPELLGSTSLLSFAVEAQQRTIGTVRLLRDALRKKAEEVQRKLQGNMGLKDDANLPNPSVKENLYSGPPACFFEHSYATCLDEIFQAWVNLLYLITNLKTILNRVVEVSGKETFKPDPESEKAVITQATECVKFLSQLKMKSVMEGLDEVNVIDDSKMKNFQILDFEERISSSFFSEMETLSKKAQEMMEHYKKETSSEAN